MPHAVMLILADNVETAQIRASILKHRLIASTIVRYGPQVNRIMLPKRYSMALIDSHYHSDAALALVRQLRSECAGPIMLLTHENSVTYHLDAYAAGVDDCVVKPVSELIFLAKIAAWLRQTPVAPSGEVSAITAGETSPSVTAGSNESYDEFRLDPKFRRVSTREGHAIKLSKLEFRLLQIFLANQGRVLETSHLLQKVWDYDNVEARQLANLVYRLRHKLSAIPSKYDRIKTVERIGYMYE